MSLFRKSLKKQIKRVMEEDTTFYRELVFETRRQLSVMYRELYDMIKTVSNETDMAREKLIEIQEFLNKGDRNNE